MAIYAPEVLADPVAVVVELVCAVEPSLDRSSTAVLVERVAPGRAKRRRLAQALLDKPMLLADGRSPAPRVTGDLLLALRSAGAERIAAPICAGCGKRLRSQCTRCGACRPVSVRDRAGRPHCVECQPDDATDPARTLREVITAIDPGLDAAAVSTAIQSAAPQIGQRRRLAWAIQDQPGLLTGDGARAPVPAVLRLIDALLEAGARGIVRPACPHCGRVIALVRPRDGVRLCRGCVANLAPNRAPVARRWQPRQAATSTAERCARPAWSANRPTRKPASAAVGCAGSRCAHPRDRAVPPAGRDRSGSARSAAGPRLP